MEKHDLKNRVVVLLFALINRGEHLIFSSFT